MRKLFAYIASNISALFFAIFLPLFSIASIVFLVKLSSITSYVQLDLFDMVRLFIYILPELLFYTIPIAFFVGSVVALTRLSHDNEMLVIFALGVNPSKLLGIFTKLALLTSAFLLFLSMVLTPHTKQLYKRFIHIKKAEAEFNISATEFGQKFGEWLLFIDSEKDNIYSNVALFHADKKEEKFILANSATIANEQGVLHFRLKDGRAFNYNEDRVTQIDYKQMNINDTSNMTYNKYEDTFYYWNLTHDKSFASLNFRKSQLVTNVLISLFPLFSLYMVFVIGIINTRHQKTYTYSYIFATTILYFTSIFVLAKAIFLWTFALVIPLWWIGSYLLYRQTILKKY
jgi:lipopolysaccharide export system permease protein